jgi:hypothetical protein
MMSRRWKEYSPPNRRESPNAQSRMRWTRDISTIRAIIYSRAVNPL